LNTNNNRNVIEQNWEISPDHQEAINECQAREETTKGKTKKKKCKNILIQVIKYQNNTIKSTIRLSSLKNKKIWNWELTPTW
jgi:hypothetical protein